MKSDLANMIAELVLRKAPGLADRLDYQAEALREAKCIDPVFGRWIDEYDVKYLLSAFALKDKDFAAMFPAMAHITLPERQQFIAAIESHCDQCLHCSLKRGYDLEMDAHIKETCQQNSDFLLQLLEEDEKDSSDEGEHKGVNAKTALPALQEI